MKFHDLNSRCFWVLEKVRMDKKSKNYHCYPKKTYEIAKSWEEKALSFWISSWLENLSCKLINFLELLLLNQNPLQGFQVTLVKSTKSSFFTLVQLHICKKLQSKFYPFKHWSELCRKTFVGLLLQFFEFGSKIHEALPWAPAMALLTISWLIGLIFAKLYAWHKQVFLRKLNSWGNHPFNFDLDKIERTLKSKSEWIKSYVSLDPNKGEVHGAWNKPNWLPNKNVYYQLLEIRQ